MVEYTTEKSKVGILTCLIIISGMFDFLINYIVNFIITDYFHLTNMYSMYLLYFLIFVGTYWIFYKLFDEIIWNKKPILNHINIYDLNGNWVGYTKTSKYKKVFNVTIKQTWTDIEMNLKTDQSSSELISFSFNKLKPIHDVCYIYKSEVKQDQNEIRTHYGTCMLKIDETNEKLTGTYFTDGQRITYGEICLKRIK